MFTRYISRLDPMPELYALYDASSQGLLERPILILPVRLHSFRHLYIQNQKRATWILKKLINLRKHFSIHQDLKKSYC